MRHCTDLGLFAIDKPMSSCKHRTAYCKKSCYNRKFFRQYRHTMKPFERTLRSEWRALTGVAVAAELSRKRKPTDRVRLCTRGEPFSTLADIIKVRDILLATPATKWWIPTRAWRDPILAAFIDAMIRPLPNAYVQASMDPSNSMQDWQNVKDLGWPVMFFGDDHATQTPLGDALARCPKTWEHTKASCSTCTLCFDGASNVHLRKH